MKIHNNRALQNLNPDADQIQRSIQAERAAKQIRTEPETAEKFRKIREMQDDKARKNGSTDFHRIHDGRESPSRGFNSRDELEGNKSEDNPQKPGGEDVPPLGRSHIDIKA
jgi:hypothetical protein